MTSRSTRLLPVPEAVFLNIPYDHAYEGKFVTLVAGLVGLGRKPRCVLEIPDGGQGRLARIVRLIRRCSASINDVSRVQVSGPLRVPRFNMPFELGLACAVAKLAGSHRYFVFEEVSHRIEHSLNDLNGHDPQIHQGTQVGILNALLNCFATRGATPSLDELHRLARRVRRASNQLKHRQRAKTMFTPVMFRLTVGVAAEVSREMGLIA